MKTNMGRAALLMLLLIGFARLALAASGPALGRSLISSGGGRSTAGNLVLHGAFGQAVIGPVASGAYAACAGYWCSTAGAHRSYLPLVLRP